MLDCADGQLARLKGTSSPVGAHLDFLMDELKAFTLVAAVAVRLWLPRPRSALAARGPRRAGRRRRRDQPDDLRAPSRVRRRDRRRPSARAPADYGEGFAQPAAPARRSPLALLEALGRFVVHYPSHIWLFALVNRIDIFLHAYLVMNAAYAARAFLGIARLAGAQAMKAIIVAAGRGQRLGAETDDIPKCMVKVGGRPILHWQLAALAAAGVDDVVIVRGYLGDRIAPPAGGPRVRFVDNPEWASNNILTSLFYAEDEMRDGFLFSYSDIVFSPVTRARVGARPPRRSR